ncbi:hypothetical protein MC7420_280 [Coleofasciculus chthonoplastes PCC 7420]|uniref:PBS lyase HEAT-like repeat domain protein n=1 Tax=Coleofasciculus chthonoplastes PCC 7420 TaxID=118168 RepID=B4VL72_9CYAN|nr:hypothetical protein [Coleofasciculus chthonoplastes]EDX77143.1 hypothetical protein MC7420_280 [Coleofasciculus chthonoplastes PCC 7420]
MSAALYDLNWQIIRVIQGDNKITPNEVIYQVPEQKLRVHYIEDFKLGLNYLVIVGHDLEATIEEIHSSLHTYRKNQIFSFMESAKSREDKILSIYYLALVAPNRYNLEIFRIFQDRLFDSDAEIRGATVLAIAYVGWKQFIELLNRLTDIESDQSVKEDCEILCENLKNIDKINSHNV